MFSKRLSEGISPSPAFSDFWGYIWGHKIPPGRKYPQMLRIQEIKTAKIGNEPRKLYDRDDLYLFVPIGGKL